MQGISSRVKLQPVTVILHWPDRWCSYCLQETEVIAAKLYHCPSCDTYSAGRTEHIEGKVVPIA